MSCDFAYRVADGRVETVTRDGALESHRGFVWIHLNSIDQDERRWLETRAKLPPVVVETLTAMETRPRCDIFPDGAIVNLRGPSEEQLSASDPLASIRLWASRGRLISAARSPLTAVPVVRRQVERGEILDPADLIVAFATEITAELDPLVAAFGDSLDESETSLESDSIFELRRTVNQVRARSIGYRRFLSPQRSALEKLATLDAPWLAEDDRQHLSAAADRAARMAEELEAIRERASLTHDALTDLRAEQIDNRALLISVIAMVFLPLTFVTGLYGMNVQGIWFADQPWAFDAIIALCGAVALLVAIWFVRQHWFRR